MEPLLIAGPFPTSLKLDGRELIMLQEKTHGRSKEIARWRPRQIPFDSVIVDCFRGFVSWSALRWLSLHNVSVTLLDFDGKPLMMGSPAGSLNGPARMDQVRAALRPDRRRAIAEALIHARMESCIAVLGAWALQYSVSNAKLRAMGRIRTARELEAHAAREYWTQFTHIPPAVFPEAGFVSRATRYRKGGDAPDPVNALLNYAYALLESRVRRSILRLGLEPGVGFLHQTKLGHEAFVYDGQEPFRWLAETSVVRFMEECPLTLKDFVESRSFGWRLMPHTAHTLVLTFADAMNRKVRVSGRSRSYDALIADELRRLIPAFERGTFAFHVPFEPGLKPMSKIARSEVSLREPESAAESDEAMGDSLPGETSNS